MRNPLSAVSFALGWHRRSGYLAVAGLLLFTNSSELGPLGAPQPVDAAAPYGATGGSTLYLEPPPPAVISATPAPAPTSGRPATPSTPYLDGLGIPVTVLAAYRRAADRIRVTDAGCHLPVALLAAIGRVESHHARGGYVDSQGTTLAPILGPRLDGGPGVAAIRDTDNGRWDGDRRWDRAVGAMQFIPGTWKRWGTDGDGAATPHNVYDATLAAGRYLCVGDRDLRDAGDLRAAILSYNHSDQYLRIVLQWMSVYAGATHAVPDRRTGSESPRTKQQAPATQPADQRSRRAPTGDRQQPGSQPAPQPPLGSDPGPQPQPLSSLPVPPAPGPVPTATPVLPVQTLDGLVTE